MTNRINKAEGADGVHRLIDMVVEEVSLVDRAANKHRFLIVKRDDAMDDNTPAEKATTDGADSSMTPSAVATWTVAVGSPLGAALAALASLTAIVELLGSLGADSNDLRLAALAEQLRATAEQILERTGFAAPSDAVDPNAPADVQARAKTEDPAKPAGTSTFASDVAAAKQALSRLAELAGKTAPAKTEKREAHTATVPTEPGAPVAESLAKLADSFRALSDTVREQQQRLGRVEKQFGLPNSAAPAEHVSKASVEDVGWPLDLNKPKDRENVDKAVSFHDL
ncbi:MAG: hypothetical protein ACK6CU_00250 [Deltaproteobacteria bacterium]